MRTIGSNKFCMHADDVQLVLFYIFVFTSPLLSNKLRSKTFICLFISLILLIFYIRVYARVYVCTRYMPSPYSLYINLHRFSFSLYSSYISLFLYFPTILISLFSSSSFHIHHIPHSS